LQTLATAQPHFQAVPGLSGLRAGEDQAALPHDDPGGAQDRPARLQVAGPAFAIGEIGVGAQRAIGDDLHEAGLDLAEDAGQEPADFGIAFEGNRLSEADRLRRGQAGHQEQRGKEESRHRGGQGSKGSNRSRGRRSRRRPRGPGPS